MSPSGAFWSVFVTAIFAFVVVAFAQSMWWGWAVLITIGIFVFPLFVMEGFDALERADDRYYEKRKKDAEGD